MDETIYKLTDGNTRDTELGLRQVGPPKCKTDQT